MLPDGVGMLGDRRQVCGLDRGAGFQSLPMRDQLTLFEPQREEEGWPATTGKSAP
jgi:hypothetical protein